MKFVIVHHRAFFSEAVVVGPFRGQERAKRAAELIERSSEGLLAARVVGGNTSEAQPLDPDTTTVETIIALARAGARWPAERRRG